MKSLLGKSRVKNYISLFGKKKNQKKILNTKETRNIRALYIKMRKKI